MATTQKVTPLNWKVPIVNSDGTPTAEFMRKWEAQSTINDSVPTSASTLSAVLDYLGTTVGALLVRGASLWGLLAPSDKAKILTAQGTSASPAWNTVSDALDAAIGSTRGAALIRGVSGWKLLVPSAAGSLLMDSGPGADPVWESLTGILDTLLGSARGSVAYRGATSWAGLKPGTSGQVLSTQGESADPKWIDQTSGGGSGSGGTVVDLYSPPTAASFGTVVNGPAVTPVPAVSDVSGLGMLLTSGYNSGNHVLGVVKTESLSAGWSLVVRFRMEGAQNYTGAGVLFSDGTKGLWSGVLCADGTEIQFQKFNTLSSERDSYQAVHRIYPPASDIYLRYRWDGTKLYVCPSRTGRYFYGADEGSTDFLRSVSQLGPAFYTENSSSQLYCSYQYWAEATS